MSDDPMHPYKKLAEQHGVDPEDEEAVLKFFRTDLQRMDKETRERAFAQILAASTGYDYLNTDNNNLAHEEEADPWIAPLLRVVDGEVDLGEWDDSIIRYMREAVAPSILGLHRLEVNQDIALDEVFSQIRPDDRRGGHERAIRVTAWVRDHQSTAVIDAFVRFLACSNAILGTVSGAVQSAKAAPALVLRDRVIDHLCFLDSLLREHARANVLSPKRNLYQDLMEELRKSASGPSTSFRIIKELVVLEREFAAKARHMERLLTKAGSMDHLQGVEDRLGFDDFYLTVRLALHNLLSNPSYEFTPNTLDVIGWIGEFMNRSDVHSRDAETSHSDENWGPPIRYSWMTLQQRYFGKAKLMAVLEDVAI